MDYKQAGVDIVAADSFIRRIAPLCRATSRKEAISAENGFASLMRIPSSYRKPVLVSSTDGVGTKLKIAFETRRHDTIGRDLVAMCVNDILVYGAEPLWFLDYFACGRLDTDVAVEVVKGIADGCREAGCALSGGETAELPDMYTTGEYDLAGFAVGVADEGRLLGAHRVEAGDSILGVASAGVHANGFSLVRRVVRRAGLTWDSAVPWVNKVDRTDGDSGETLATSLLTPTSIYVRPVLNLCQKGFLHAVAHITGGGLTGNIPRVLGEDKTACIQESAWPRPAVFDWLCDTGDIPGEEMLRVFNCGIGMVLLLPDAHVDESIAVLDEAGFAAWRIGCVKEGRAGVVYE